MIEERAIRFLPLAVKGATSDRVPRNRSFQNLRSAEVLKWLEMRRSSSTGGLQAASELQEHRVQCPR